MHFRLLDSPLQLPISSSTVNGENIKASGFNNLPVPTNSMHPPDRLLALSAKREGEKTKFLKAI